MATAEGSKPLVVAIEEISEASTFSGGLQIRPARSGPGDEFFERRKVVSGRNLQMIKRDDLHSRDQRIAHTRAADETFQLQLA